MEGASILIVEDEAISALYIKNVLTRMKYMVAGIVSTGEDAIDKAGKKQPDLILMDIRLSGEMDGIEAAEIIHSKYDIPVVFLTAHLDDESMRRAMATDPAGYVPKPTSERELRGTVEMALKNDVLKKQLRASEERYRRIFKTASVSISEMDFSRVKGALDEFRRKGVTDLPAFLENSPDILLSMVSMVRVIDGNDWNLQLFNAPDGETLLNSLYGIVTDETMPLFQDLLLAIWEGKQFHEGETTIRTLKGEMKYVTVNVAFLTGGIDLSRVLMVVTDITDRRWAEKALAESEERYRILVENAVEMISVVKGKYFSFVNNQAQFISGYTREELLATPIIDFVHPDDREETIRIYQSIMNGDPIKNSYQIRMITKSGETRWVEIKSRLISWMGEPASLNFYTDITERKKTEEQLRLQALVLDQIQDWVTITDLEGRITYVNRAVCKHLKHTHEELIGQSVDTYGEDLARGVSQEEIINKTLATGEWRGEVVNFDSEGNDSILDFRTRLIYDEHNEPFVLCGISTDITQRVKIEQALAKSEARYRRIVETTQEGIWVLDKAFRFTFMNDRLTELFGYSFEELAGNSLDILIPEDDFVNHKKRLEDRKEGNADQFESRLRRKDGSIIWVFVSTTPIIDENGQFQGSFAMISDITARKEAEQVVKREQARTRTMDALSQELSKLNLDFQATLQTATQRIIELCGDICLIRMLSEDGQSLKPVAVHHPDPGVKEFVINAMNDSPSRIDEGLTQHVYNTGHAMMFSYAETPELVQLIKKEFMAILDKLDYASGLFIPMVAQGHILGDIIIGRRKDQEPYSNQDIVFYQEITDRIALTIANAQMYSKIQRELDERKTAEAAVRLSEEKYRDLFELSPDSITLISPEGMIMDCNLSTSKISGVPKDEMIGKPFFYIANLPPEKHPEFTILFNQIMSGDHTDPFEMEVTLPHGEKRNLEIFAKLMKKDGVITAVQAISRNVTDRRLNEIKLRDSLAEKETLLNELNHRVKNNLASIVSILDLQKSYVSDNQVSDMLTELQERIRVMALIHEQLYRSKNLNQIDFEQYLVDLTGNLMRALQKGRDIALDLHTDPAQLGVAVAIPCGQIITELVTNALKYAFPEDIYFDGKKEMPRIGVSFRVANDHYLINVTDNGIGLPASLDFNNSETLGLQLVMLLTNQLNGSIETNCDQGTSVTITFNW